MMINGIGWFGIDAPMWLAILLTLAAGRCSHLARGSCHR